MNKNLYEDSIILIGPSGAGKSTVADDMEKRLKMPRVCLDKMASDARKNGERARFRTPDEFSYYMIHSLISAAEKREGAYAVVDFGAGHSIYKDKTIFAKVKKELKGDPQKYAFIGIDYGNTYSSIGYYSPITKRIEVIDDQFGKIDIPTIVGFKQNSDGKIENFYGNRIKSAKKFM